MGAKRLEDLVAYQLAVQFKLQVYDVLRQSPAVAADERFRMQLQNAAASVEVNIAEGWRRFSAAEFGQFLRYARASLEEAERWLRDGVARGYYTDEAARPALETANRCGGTVVALWRSLRPFARK